MDVVLDTHAKELLEQYRERFTIYKRIEELASESLNKALDEQGIYITSFEHRIKAEKSLARKLELKGSKYASLEDITDILGVRIITFYTDDVDKVAAIVKGIFNVDWNESIDKRKAHQLTSFGYNSLHYICSLPKNVVDDPQMPELNKYRFEIQMRTALQHVWSTVEHDIGYKGEVKLPPEYRRQFSRLSGMLELIDDEFSRLRITMTDYRRQIQGLVESGKLDEVPLDTENFRKYLETSPFSKLNKRIAAVNQAEIMPTTLLPYVPVLRDFGLNTLGDVDRFIVDNSEYAYQMAISALALTDLDIMAESVALQNLCIVHILKNGDGKKGLVRFFDVINGKKQENEAMAQMTLEQAASLPFMK